MKKNLRRAREAVLFATAAVIAIAIAIAVTTLSPARATAATYESDVSIDVAIALDVSGSMRGLIDAARLKLWEIVNDLSTAEPAPRLRVALLTYGNQRGSAQSGWARIETDFTDDLDLVSERLFALQSRGADEYVGRVLKLALQDLSWTGSPDALRLLFLAGNEEVDQDPLIDYRHLALDAPRGEIQLSAVFCGVEQAPAAAGWKEMAELATGRFATIDHHSRTVLVKTPYDRELAELGDLLSETFIGLGDEGKSRKRTQLKQDANARRHGLAVAASRAVTKSGRCYSPQWELATAYRAGEVDVYEVQGADLPPVMRRMEIDERMYYLEDLLAVRAELEARIGELGRARRGYVDEQMTARGIDSSRAFDNVVRQTIRQEAKMLGLTFGGK